MSTLAFAARTGLQHLCAGILVALVVTFGVPAAHAEPAQTSAEFFEKFNPGQQAYQKKDFATALRSGKEARAVAKSPFEKKAALTLIYGSAASTRNYPDAIDALEALLQTEGVAAGEKLGYHKVLGQMYGQVNKFDRAILETNEYIKGSGGQPSDYAALAQYYFAAKNCPQSLQALDKALAGGKQADEDQLKVQMNCYTQAHQGEKVQAAAEEALKRFPKKIYYSQVLRALWERKIDDMALAEVLRLGFDRDWLDEESDYVKLADLALDVGTTAEAQRVLERGIQKKVVKNADKVERLLKQAKDRATEDAKTVGQLDAEARAGKNGESDVRLGYRYYSMGQFDKAAEALNRGLSAERLARVKRPDDANMMLGIVYKKLKKGAEADKAFNVAKADARMAPAAKLWLSVT
jgi:tetratricopeptide (TPR) repeat protein